MLNNQFGPVTADLVVHSVYHYGPSRVQPCWICKRHTRSSCLCETCHARADKRVRTMRKLRLAHALGEGIRAEQLIRLQGHGLGKDAAGA